MKKNNTKKEEVIKDQVTSEEVKVEKTKPIEMIAEELKEKYKLKEVFITEISGTDLQIIWKRLKRSEYKEILTDTYSEDPDLAFYEKQEAFAKKVILYPENVDELIEDFAGISDYIASETMIKTGFGITSTKAV